jgi:benzaldehyde dehydrogenase (NAD)
MNGLLHEQDWTGKIFSDGWVDAPETIETIEPATGDVLGTAGVANAASVAAATRSAARAQREWAALPIAERAAIVRRAGDVLERYRGEISGWMVRESGAIPPKAAVEITASIGQLDQAASLISHPLGYASSNGGHFGGVGQVELWTEWQWLTTREKAEPFPF